MQKIRPFFSFCAKISLIFAILALVGCNAPKKIAGNTRESIINNEKQNEAINSETYNFADTTKKQDVEINYFKIEYYPPWQDEKPDTMPDNSIFPENLLSNSGNKNPKKPPGNKGAIKSIEGYTVNAKNKQAGVNGNKENKQVNRNTEKNENINRQSEIKEQSAEDPYRWRYIFGTLILVVIIGIGGYFLLRKSKFVISIVSFLKNLF